MATDRVNSRSPGVGHRNNFPTGSNRVFGIQEMQNPWVGLTQCAQLQMSSLLGNRRRFVAERSNLAFILRLRSYLS